MKYAEIHRRSIEDPTGFWAEQAALDRLAPTAHPGARRLPAAVRALVRRRRDQPVPQRRRPLAGDAGRPARADLRLHRNRAGTDLHLCRVVAPGPGDGGSDAVARGRQGRSGADLHADDPGGGLRHAGLRADRRDPLGRVRRLRRRQPRQPDRRRRTQADHLGGRRFARRQGGALQGVAGRGDRTRRRSSPSTC